MATQYFEIARVFALQIREEYPDSITWSPDGQTLLVGHKPGPVIRTIPITDLSIG